VRRIVVVGGRGFFGSGAVDLLREAGLAPLVASRRPGGDLVLDPEDRSGLRSLLRSDDVVLDAAGPFQDRSTALVEAALEAGFDAIDISDSLDHAHRILSLRDRIGRSGITVLNSASALSAVSAAMVRASGISAPVRASSFLAPSARRSARPGVTRSLLRSVGRPIRVRRGGELAAARGWGESRAFELPRPLPRARGRLFESSDAALLPEVWPSLRTVESYLSTNVPGFDRFLDLAARFAPARKLAERLGPRCLPLARLLGSRRGWLAQEIEAADGAVCRTCLWSDENAYLIALAPCVLAAGAIAAGRFSGGRGLVPADRQVDPEELFAWLRSKRVRWECDRSEARRARAAEPGETDST
jgi:saccharopine dehydrogenase-like protein